MRKFDTKTIQPLIIATNDRVKLCDKMPKKFHYYFRIEGKNMCKEWMVFYKTIESVLKSISPETIYSVKDAAKLAYFFNLFAKFFQFYGTPADDGDYCNAVDYFFNKYEQEVGKRHNELLLYNNAFVN